MKKIPNNKKSFPFTTLVLTCGRKGGGGASGFSENSGMPFILVGISFGAGCCAFTCITINSETVM